MKSRNVRIRLALATLYTIVTIFSTSAEQTESEPPGGADVYSVFGYVFSGLIEAGRHDDLFTYFDALRAALNPPTYASTDIYDEQHRKSHIYLRTAYIHVSVLYIRQLTVLLC